MLYSSTLLSAGAQYNFYMGATGLKDLGDLGDVAQNLQCYFTKLGDAQQIGRRRPNP